MQRVGVGGERGLEEVVTVTDAEGVDVTGEAIMAVLNRHLQWLSAKIQVVSRTISAFITLIKPKATGRVGDKTK
ncbi:hypothetical protein QJS04_geneDACA006585 [Acorus gramineus]|uniref:Uncharacterized protein n=1 Tax=Acorus gramineus TaxID=55184 RepID=A0AAV9B1A9_ACOGR|nr:hypothetical protein QJS04_geneDACA006585 [Acorus gramineus]